MLGIFTGSARGCSQLNPPSSTDTKAADAPGRPLHAALQVHTPRAQSRSMATRALQALLLFDLLVHVVLQYLLFVYT